MTLEKTIKALLTFGALYLLIDSAVHLSNIRLTDVGVEWPTSALSFSGFMSQIYASLGFLVAFLGWEIQKDLKKYKSLLFILGIWAIFHGSYLFFRTMDGLTSSFEGIPSLVVWLPFYTFLTTLESIILLIFGTIVILWRFKNGKNS